MGYNAYYGNAGGDWNAGLDVGSGNVTQDPRLLDPAGGDFSLDLTSPCIDQGDPARYPVTDYDGLGRPFGSGPDMGAYESYGGVCFARAGAGLGSFLVGD